MERVIFSFSFNFISFSLVFEQMIVVHIKNVFFFHGGGRDGSGGVGGMPWRTMDVTKRHYCHYFRFLYLFHLFFHVMLELLNKLIPFFAVHILLYLSISEILYFSIENRAAFFFFIVPDA